MKEVTLLKAETHNLYLVEVQVTSLKILVLGIGHVTPGYTRIIGGKGSTPGYPGQGVPNFFETEKGRALVSR